MELNKTTIEEAVIARVCDQIMDEWQWREQAREALAKRIDAAFKNGVDEVVDAAISKAVADGFDHEYRKAVDVFGKAAGETTTVRAELAKLVSGYWTQKVDKYGKPVSSDTYGDKITRAEWHMTQVCAADFTAAMKQEAVNVTAALKDGLRKELRASTDKMLSELFRVKSVQDKAEGLPS